MTPILKVLTEYCDVYVDDDRLIDLKNSNFPLWALKMWSYLRAGIPLFTLPPDMLSFLTGDTGEKLTEPLFASFQEETLQQGDVTIQSEYIGYEYCSARIVAVDQYGDVYYQPLQSGYDAETGTIVVYVPETEEGESTVIEIDLYKDGFFAEDLNMEVMRILALCFAVVWQKRFINNWLSNIPKIEDASFAEQNRANKENADTTRFLELKGELESAMRRLDTNNQYQSVVRGKHSGF